MMDEPKSNFRHSRQYGDLHAHPNSLRFLKPTPRDLRSAGLTPFEEPSGYNALTCLLVLGCVFVIGYLLGAA